MRNTFINTVIQLSKERDETFFISGDAGLGVFCEFKDEYPQRFINLGVAEQNAISFAAGMALVGFKVYYYNIIPFVLYRCYEQVRNDICYQKLPVVLVGIGSGVTYAPQGMTHYSIEDIGIAQTLPNLTVFSPIDPIEAELAAHYSLEADTPVYVRLAKRGEPNIHSSRDFDITEPQVLKEGEGSALIFHGSISEEVMRAYELLVKEDMYPTLISIPMLQPLHRNKLLGHLENIRTVICVEEHYKICGLGSIVSRLLGHTSPHVEVVSMGIENNYIHEIKNTQGMRDFYHISAKDIAEITKKYMRE
ncbi:MAG: transketolase family protein [bacterium]